MPSALEQLQNALSAFYHPRNSDSGQRYRGQLFLWKKVADRLVHDFAPHWADDDVASVVRELAAYTKFLTRRKPQRVRPLLAPFHVETKDVYVARYRAQVAKLGEPSAAQHLPTLNRLYNEANSTPGHVPFRLQISLDQLKTSWGEIGGPQHELDDWLGDVQAFMSEKASSMSPAEVLAIANELATYSHTIRSGMDTEDFNFDAGQTVRSAPARFPLHQQPELQPRRPT